VNKYGLERRETEAEREAAGVLQRNPSGIKDRTLKEGIEKRLSFINHNEK